MEDVTAQPMRRIAKRIANPGLMVTEFVSAMAIHYGAKKTFKKLWVGGNKTHFIKAGLNPDKAGFLIPISEALHPTLKDIHHKAPFKKFAI